MKKILALVIAAVLLMSAIPAWAEEDTQEPVVITLFHTNDVHSRYNSDAGMGYAMMASFVNAARETGNVLVLDAGDTLHGTVFANAVQGESIVQIMNTIGYDVMTPGNHDFNYGFDRLKELEAMMNFPLVSANLRLKDGEEAFKPYTLLESGGKVIGVVGASNPQMESAIHPDHIEPITFGGVEYVSQAVQAAKADGADAIIVLAHWGCNDAYDPNSVEALATLPDVALVIDGHSHTVLYDIAQGDEAALVTSTGEYLNNLGKVTLTLNPDKSIEVVAELIPNPGLFEDHGVINAIGIVEDGQSAVLDEVVGETTVRLEGERGIVRTAESNWGNLATDIFIDATGADVAIMNGGNIRETLEAGPITVRSINTVFPFANILVTQKVTGQAILDVLEVGLSLYPETSGGFPQVGGMKITFDPDKPAGERIVEVLVGGEPIDPEATYMLATNDYLAAGGDNYAALAEFPVEMLMGTMDEIIVNYIKVHTPVSPETEGRILPVGAEMEAEEEPVLEEAAPDADDTTGVEAIEPEESAIPEEADSAEEPTDAPENDEAA